METHPARLTSSSLRAAGVATLSAASSVRFSLTETAHGGGLAGGGGADGGLGATAHVAREAQLSDSEGVRLCDEGRPAYAMNTR